MDKIASPQDLQAELRSLVAFVHASEKPDRQVIAAKLRDLASRVAGSIDDTDIVKVVKQYTGPKWDVTVDSDGRVNALLVEKGRELNVHMPDLRYVLSGESDTDYALLSVEDVGTPVWKHSRPQEIPYRSERDLAKVFKAALRLLRDSADRVAAREGDLERPAQDALNLARKLYLSVGPLEAAAKLMKALHPEASSNMLRQIPEIDRSVRRLYMDLQADLGLD